MDESPVLMNISRSEPIESERQDEFNQGVKQAIEYATVLSC